MTPLTPPQTVAVIGLGYVGLPLAAALGRELATIGYDTNEERIAELKKGYDRNGDIEPAALASPMLACTSDASRLVEADVLIVAVPTPVDQAKRPDFSYLVAASRTVGKALAARAAARAGDASPAIVVYESTVYPGCTEEICIPQVEASSGLRAGIDFKVGYSPERINPGDREHTLETVVKIVAAQDPQTLDVLSTLYRRVAKAGVHEAPDIRTAEAAKVIENTQRDINIALMNELAIIFHRLGIDTDEVLKAARTKWNFLPFKPGLVGGHCIPEDPYYLTFKAESVGYHPQVVLAGRRINDSMGSYVGQQLVKELARAGRRGAGKVLVLGLAFKQNVRDVRGTRVLDIVRELEAHGFEVDVHDPLVGPQAIRAMHLRALGDPELGASVGCYDAVVLAVAHDEYARRSASDFAAFVRPDPAPGVIVDVKSMFEAKDFAPLGVRHWRL